MLSEQAKIVRRTGLGGTDIAAILLPNYKYKSVQQLYKEKVEGFEPEINTELQAIFQHGIDSEERIAGLYAKIINDRPKSSVMQIMSPDSLLLLALPRPTFSSSDDSRYAIYRHPQHHFLIASPDRFVMSVLGQPIWGLELKTASYASRHRWGESGSHFIPLHYYLQIQHYMLVTGLKCWDVAVLFGQLVKDGAEEFRIYSFDYDEEIGQAIIEEGGKFWNTYIADAVCPPDDYKCKVKIDFLKCDKTSRVELGAEYIAVVNQIVEAKQKILQYDDTANEGIGVVAHAMGNAAYGFLPDGRIIKRSVTNNGKQKLTLI